MSMWGSFHFIWTKCSAARDTGLFKVRDIGNIFCGCVLSMLELVSVGLFCGDKVLLCSDVGLFKMRDIGNLLMEAFCDCKHMYIGVS